MQPLKKDSNMVIASERSATMNRRAAQGPVPGRNLGRTRENYLAKSPRHNPIVVEFPVLIAVGAIPVIR
jgi:hypothetical protein